MKFNIPKDSEDRRKLLIDLENQVGVIQEEGGFFIVVEYEKSNPHKTTKSDLETRVESIEEHLITHQHSFTVDDQCRTDSPINAPSDAFALQNGRIPVKGAK